MKDTIYRQDAMTLPVLPKEYRQYQTTNLDDAYDLGWDDCQMHLNSLPSVQQEQKTGKWIVWGGMDVPENHGRHKCSECGEFALLRYEKPLRKEILSDFCPNCGAKMEVEDD